MSEEEKEAIRFLRRDIKFRKNNKWFENCIIEPKTAQTLLNLIDKLQKENKELNKLTDNLRGENAELRDDLDKLQKENEVLKEVHKEFTTLCRELKTDNTLMSAKSVMEKVVSKDKIRDKIKELEDSLDGCYQANEEVNATISIDIYTELLKWLNELLGE